LDWYCSAADYFDSPLFNRHRQAILITSSGLTEIAICYEDQTIQRLMTAIAPPPTPPSIMRRQENAYSAKHFFSVTHLFPPQGKPLLETFRSAVFFASTNGGKSFPCRLLRTAHFVTPTTTGSPPDWCVWTGRHCGLIQHQAPWGLSEAAR